MAVNATAIWRVRPSGSNTNGGGYDPGISGAATDYSQQNAAQATGVNGTASGTTTFSDSTANAFTAAMIGNAIWIASGAGFTVGAYFVTAFTSASTVTLDRSPGTGTVAHWALGGGWADPVTNMASGSPVVPGNTIYVLGSGTPNPSSYVYDYTITTSATVSGDTTNGRIIWANDPSTPSYKAFPDTTGGMPTIRLSAVMINSANYTGTTGLWFVSNGSAYGASPNYTRHLGTVFDQFGSDVSAGLGSNGVAFMCEIWSSQAGSPVGGSAITCNGGEIGYCNIHDCVSSNTINHLSGPVTNCIVAKNAGHGVAIGGNFCTVANCTIDGNGFNGIDVGSPGSLEFFDAYNNIITNHTSVSRAGLNVQSGTTAANDRLKQFVDFNSFYNNTANYSLISAGPHDTALVVTPYVASSTQNYTLA